MEICVSLFCSSCNKSSSPLALWNGCDFQKANITTDPRKMFEILFICQCLTWNSRLYVSFSWSDVRIATLYDKTTSSPSLARALGRATYREENGCVNRASALSSPPGVRAVIFSRGSLSRHARRTERKRDHSVYFWLAIKKARQPFPGQAFFYAAGSASLYTQLSKVKIS